MSAGPTNPPPAGGDPSMEDILASIRRILSEDEPAASAASESGNPDLKDPGSKDSGNKDPGSKDRDTGVLVLDPSMMVGEPTHNAPVEQAMSPKTQPEPVHAPDAAQAAAQPPSRSEPDRAGLVAPEAAAAAASSVGTLVRTLTERSAQVHHGGPTIEDVVRDEIRPIVKQWLDTNLPPLVERLVRIEIERVVGRAVP